MEGRFHREISSLTSEKEGKNILEKTAFFAMSLAQNNQSCVFQGGVFLTSSGETAGF